MSKYCECGMKIYTNGGRGAGDRHHDQCQRCYRSHRDSERKHR